MSDAITVTVLHFIPPNAERVTRQHVVTKETAAAYAKAQAVGLRLTCEVLSTGQVSICLEHPNLGDFDCTVTYSRAESIRWAIARVVERFTIENWKRWSRAQEV